MAGPHRTLPILAGICDQIDDLFVEAVGPFGQLVVTESREVWLATGSHVKTSDVKIYIDLLAKEIPEPSKRKDFVSKAGALIGST